MKSAAKVLHQTAKTCQYLKEFYKKMHFFLIYDENFHLLRSGDKKAAPSEGAAGEEKSAVSEANTLLKGKSKKDKTVNEDLMGG